MAFVCVEMKQQTKPSKPVIIIQATNGWSFLDLSEFWQYKELVWILTLRNIKSRYRQMALGPLWIILIPLVNMVIFTLVFGKLANLPSDGIPYPLFTYVALLPWTYFSNASIESVESLLKSINLISKVYFPRLVVPVSAVLSGLVDFFVSFLVLLGMMVYYGFVPRVTMLLLPFYLLLAMITALCVGLWNTNLAVRFRDLKYATTYGLQAWMYATPVAYSANLVPESFRVIYWLNPMYWVIEGFRWALLGQGRGFHPFMMISVGLIVILLFMGAFVFRRTERTIVDFL